MSQHSVQVTKSCLLRCMVGQEPTEFDATRGQVLANITELLVRQLEQKWAMSQARNSSVQLMRSLACYDEAFLFLDTSRQGDWRVLHMNKAASKLLGKRGSSRRASEHVGGGGGGTNQKQKTMYMCLTRVASRLSGESRRGWRGIGGGRELVLCLVIHPRRLNSAAHQQHRCIEIGHGQVLSVLNDDLNEGQLLQKHCVNSSTTKNAV